MTNIFASIFFRILNWSPVFHASTDNQFGSVDGRMPNRFSLLGLSLGKRKYYVISMVKKHESLKLEYFDHLSFDSACKIKSESEINEKVEKYQGYLSEKNDDVELVKNQIDFLKHKMSLSQIRIAGSYNKINAYTAILLVYVGFIAFMLGKVSSMADGNALLQFTVYTLSALSIYYTFNCVLFVHFALLIKGYVRSSFKDLKENSSTEKLACAYYTDWYSMENEAQVAISVVANIQKYFTRSFVMFLSVWLVLFMTGGDKSSIVDVTKKNGEYLVFNGLGEFQKQEFVKFLSKANEGSGKIFIIRSKLHAGSSIVSDFIKTTVSSPDQVAEVYIKNYVIDPRSVTIKHKD